MIGVIFLVGGVLAILYAVSQQAADSGTPPTPATPDTAGVTDDGSQGADDGVDVPNAVAGSVPSNSSVDTLNASDFNPNSGPVPINPLDPDTWPGGDRIWDVARAIAHQEGYGVSAQNAPTRNNNPGDLSDGFDQFGGEQLDSKITKFPDAATGWNWLYNKLKNIHDGRSKKFSNNMTWLEFGHTYASDPNWANGVTRTLGVSASDRVGDYWDA